MRPEVRRALVGAAAGAILGALAAVLYTRLEDSRAARTGVVRRELAPLDMQQLATVGVHVRERPAADTLLCLSRRAPFLIARSKRVETAPAAGSTRGSCLAASGGSVYRILSKLTLTPVTTEYVIEAPEIARKAQAGQFVVVRVHEQGERIPLTIADSDREAGTITVVLRRSGRPRDV